MLRVKGALAADPAALLAVMVNTTPSTTVVAVPDTFPVVVEKLKPGKAGEIE